MEPNFIAPAPWSLKGNGTVLLYQFSRTFIEKHGFLDDFQQQGYKNGLGAVILMEYSTSGAGPYRELLFLPGLINVKGTTGFSVSKIYVSTYDSAMSGKRNWGIPKELADFKIERMEDGSRLWKVKKDGITFFEATIKPNGISFPFTSRILPLSRLIQKGSRHFLLTKPKAQGMAKLASLRFMHADQDYFPPIQDLSPLVTVFLKSFDMEFPVAWQLGDGKN